MPACSRSAPWWRNQRAGGVLGEPLDRGQPSDEYPKVNPSERNIFSDAQVEDGSFVRDQEYYTWLHFPAAVAGQSQDELRPPVRYGEQPLYLK